MERNEYRKHMLLEKEDEVGTILYRVLEVAEQILVIDCKKKTMPVWKDYKDMEGFTAVKSAEELSGMISLEDLSAEERRAAIQRYNWISEILPFVADAAVRSELIKKVAEERGLSCQTVRNHLCTYLASMNISSLAPKKRDIERELTADEKNIRKSLNRWYYNTKKRTLKTCYTLMLQHFYCDSSGKLLEKYPSYYQFRYFFRKYNKKTTELISRNGLSYYQRNQRPVVGDKVQTFAPMVGFGMLDSTVCDIYLVSNGGELVGRPILTLCVDAFSGMICGYTLTWEGGMYSLRDLMLNVIEDKVERCKQFGIEILEEHWPSRQLPMKLVTDRGSEYKGYNLEQITELGVELINLQSFRADNKGPVEQCFNALQNYFKPALKGKGVIEVDFQERGARDYRKDACLTMDDFERIILRCIIFYNSNRVLEKFPFTVEMLEAEVKPIPCDVWKWSCEQFGANLLSISKDTLIKTLLPRTTAKFCRLGLLANRMHYHNPMYQEAYLEGKEAIIAYDPDSTNHVWLIESGSYIQFDLIESRFKDKDLSDVDRMKKKQRELVKEVLPQKTQAEVDLARTIQLIADTAAVQAEPSIKGIRNNRKKEQIKEHKHYAEEVIDQ